MYTRNHEFFFTQRPFECKFTLEGIIMNFSKIALFAVAAYGFSQAAITGNVVDESGAPVKNAAITGRPLPITSFIKVADVLYGKVKPTGKLPHTWPKDAKQIPINVGDGKKGLYPYGYGLTY